MTDDRPEPASPAGETVERASLGVRARRLLRAVRDGDESTVESAILQLSRSRGVFSPLVLMVGGIVTLFLGLKLLVSNWRLTLVQILPAMWIWVLMLDWKAHVLHGRSFHVLTGPILIPIVLAIAAVTAATFFLNAVFGFAITGPTPPQVRPAYVQARTHGAQVLVPGFAVGLLVGLSAVVVTRYGHPWFAISMGAVVGLLMICYVAVPARLIGVKPVYTRREKLTIGAVGGTVGAIVATPPYILGRLAILMLGSHALLIPGVVLLTFAAVLQAGATGAVKAVKMSTKLGAAPATRDAGRAGDDRSPSA